MPNLDDPRRKGDLLVILVVETPTALIAGAGAVVPQAGRTGGHDAARPAQGSFRETEGSHHRRRPSNRTEEVSWEQTTGTEAGYDRPPTRCRDRWLTHRTSDATQLTARTRTLARSWPPSRSLHNHKLHLADFENARKRLLARRGGGEEVRDRAARPRPARGARQPRPGTGGREGGRRHRAAGDRRGRDGRPVPRVLHGTESSESSAARQRRSTRTCTRP